MPEYRRAFVPGGTFFFTLVTWERRPLFAEASNVELLRSVIRQVREERPFQLLAAVVLPDHMHLIWVLPEGDTDFSRRIGRTKALFTHALSAIRQPAADASRRRHREGEVWQRRFWEHLIRDQRDLEHHLHYIHYNPVKHGLAACPHLWPASSFLAWVAKGAYDSDWCCCCGGGRIIRPYPESLDRGVGE